MCNLYAMPSSHRAARELMGVDARSVVQAAHERNLADVGRRCGEGMSTAEVLTTLGGRNH